MDTQAMAVFGAGRPLSEAQAMSTTPAGSSRQALTRRGLVCGASI